MLPRHARWNLTDVCLSGADLRLFDLSNADLRWADLRSAQLNGADLQGADLRDAYLSEAWVNGTRFEGAIVTAEQMASTRALGLAIVCPAVVAGLQYKAIRQNEELLGMLRDFEQRATFSGDKPK